MVKDSKKLTVCVLLGAALAWHAGALAQEPEDQIKYRQSYMSAIGGHMGAISLLLRERVRHPEHLVRHADALAALGSDILSVFPADSDLGETRAREKIWSDWDDFTREAERARTTTAAFARAARGGERGAMAAAFAEVGEVCKSCHKSYRREDD